MGSQKKFIEQESFRKRRIAELGSALENPVNKALKQNLTVPPHLRPLRVYGTRLTRPPTFEELVNDPQIASLLRIPEHYRKAKPRPWHPARNGYYYGEARTGKTWRAVKYLKGALMLESQKHPAPPKDDDYDWYEYEKAATFHFSGHYISLQKWFRAIYAAFENAPEDVEVLQAGLVDPEYIVLDDFGVTKPTEWVVSTLESVLDQRISDRKPTIVTGNWRPSSSDFVEKFGVRIISRLKEMGTHPVTGKVGE